MRVEERSDAAIAADAWRHRDDVTWLSEVCQRHHDVVDTGFMVR
jgi:hypothetical protein